MKFRRIGFALALGAGLAYAQTFEVASVKLSSPGSRGHCRGGPGTADPGQFHCDAGSLLALISVAYHVDHFQISSRTPLDRDRFDVAAKVPAGATREQFRVMLQNLLAERLHLRLHKESREFQGFELTVANNGPKFKESAADSGTQPETRKSVTAHPDGIQVHIAARRESMSGLAGLLQENDGTPIIDKTGLAGLYDFELVYTPRQADVWGTSVSSSETIADAPSLSSAVIQQLGLQLVPKKLPFEVLVVESFDRIPVEN